jgi:hypothetical protein
LSTYKVSLWKAQGERIPLTKKIKKLEKALKKSGKKG